MIGDFNMIDASRDGAFMAPLDERLKKVMFCFGNNFNPAIRKIFDAASNGKLPGFFLGKGAKVDALNAAGNQDVDSAHHSLILQQ